jgi:putative hemolysin
MFVPETMKANTLFDKMCEKREHFAIVIDEYGGLSGIVSIYDIFEVIFGDFDEDESAKAFDIEIIDNTTWRIDGLCDLEDAAEALKLSMPIDTYDTFSGFICGIIGRIPDEGESFKLTWKDIEIEVLDVKNQNVKNKNEAIDEAIAITNYIERNNTAPSVQNDCHCLTVCTIHTSRQTDNPCPFV